MVTKSFTHYNKPKPDKREQRTQGEKQALYQPGKFSVDLRLGSTVFVVVVTFPSMPPEVTARSWNEIETHPGHVEYICSYSKYKSTVEFNFQFCP